jgi:S-adenosylmethionine hydrolase
MQFLCMGRSLFAFILLLALSLSGCSSPSSGLGGKPDHLTNRPTIVFMTDFGTANDSVAICRAVILQIVPDIRIMDVTHQVTPFSIEEGSRFLSGVTPYYPAGTVFLAVVDPGVGTSRKAIVAKSKKGQFFVLPDNGLITPVADRDGIEGVREITNQAWMIGDKVSSTFHGRDIFSPTAAHLAAGEDWIQVGPEVRDLVRLQPRVAKVTDRGVAGEIIGLDDPFGSLITNIPGDDFKKLGYVLGEKVAVTIDKKPFTMPYEKTFMEVPIGQPLVYVDSRGRVGIALNERDFSKTYKVSPNVPIFISKKGDGVQ